MLLGKLCSLQDRSSYYAVKNCIISRPCPDRGKDKAHPLTKDDNNSSKSVAAYPAKPALYGIKVRIFTYQAPCIMGLCIKAVGGIPSILKLLYCGRAWVGWACLVFSFGMMI